MKSKDRAILQIFWDTLEIYTLDFSQTPAVCAVARDWEAVFNGPLWVAQFELVARSD